MISVSCLLDQPLHGFSMGTMDCLQSETTPPFQGLMGGIFFVLNPETASPARYRREIEFGSLRQFGRPRGPLRDKGVDHLNAKGHVCISRVDSVMTPKHESNVYADHVGQFDVLPDPGHPAIEHAVGAIVPWGESVERRVTFTVPKWTVNLSKEANPVSREFWQSAKYSASAEAYVLVFGRDGYLQTYDGIFGEETEFFEPSASVIFLEVHYSGTAASVRASVVFNASVHSSGRLYVSLPAKDVFVENLVAEPRRYGVGCGSQVSLIPLSGYEPNLGGVLPKFEQVCAFLLSGALTSYAREVLGSADPEACEDLSWGEFGRDIVKQQDYTDVNTLLLTYDLARFTELTSGFRSVAKGLDILSDRVGDVGAYAKSFFGGVRKNKAFLDDGKWLTQLLSSAGLGYDYGVTPTIRDLRGVHKGMRQLWRDAKQPLRRHSRRSLTMQGFLDSPIRVERTLTVESSPFPIGLFQQLSELSAYTQVNPRPVFAHDKRIGNFWETAMGTIEDMRHWNAYPSFETWWDFKRYSFVIDWFIDVGEQAENVDIVLRGTQYYPINIAIHGEKRTWQPAFARIWPVSGVSGVVEFIHYYRYTSSELPLPSVTVPEVNTDGYRHVGEAFALVVTRL